MSFYFIYFDFPGWKGYLLGTLLIPSILVFLILFFFQIESPVYALFVRKDMEMFNKIVDRLGKVNRI